MWSGSFASPGTGMIIPEEEKAILDRAYVPEHSVGLMTTVSGGEPFLFEDYFCCRTPHNLIVVGYPLGHEFELGQFEEALHRMVRRFHPAGISLVAPQAPRSFGAAFVERQTDTYYKLLLPAAAPGSTLGRMVRKAREIGTVERATELTEAHGELIREFVERVDPPRRIAELLRRMRDYVGVAKDSLVLSARDRDGTLTAFFVVDCAPKEFATYVIGCHSKRNYMPGASDLLMSEMTKLCSKLDKRYLHLGIGVNAGIRAFKEKWGGVPTRPYELCELVLKKPSLFDALLKVGEWPRTLG
jgi:hypothetical protein